MCDEVMFTGLCFCAVLCDLLIFFFFKQKTAYEMRISDWSSDVCSSDLHSSYFADRQGEPDSSDSSPPPRIHGHFPRQSISVSDPTSPPQWRYPMAVKFTLNGKPVTVNADPDMPIGSASCWARVCQCV